MTQFTYQKLQWISPKEFRKNIAKHDEYTAEQQRDLTAFQKACSVHSKHISKFQEALFKVVVFGSIYLYGLGLICVDGRWFWDQKWMWTQSAKSMPQPLGTHSFFNLKVYYWLQIAYAMHRAYYQFLEHTRRDFWAMFIHHWVATGLLIGSYVTGYCRVGATVLLLNDNCDLMMPVAKLAGYSGFRKVEVIFTGMFVVSWIPMRIFLFGYKVMYSIMVLGYAQLKPHAAGWLCAAGLLIIYMLQFFWTKYLLEMVVSKLLKGKGVIDVRSDDDKVAGAAADHRKHE